MDQTEFVKSIKTAIGVLPDSDDEHALTYALYYINEGKKKVLGSAEADTRSVDVTQLINPSNAALVLAVAKMIIDLAMQITKEDDTKEKETPDGEETIHSSDRRSDT